MYLLRSVDCVADVEERALAGELPGTNRELSGIISGIKDKVNGIIVFHNCDHIFVRISQKAGNSDGGSYRVAWQGFVSKEHGRDSWEILTLPEKASLYELHPLAKAQGGLQS